MCLNASGILKYFSVISPQSIANNPRYFLTETCPNQRVDFEELQSAHLDLAAPMFMRNLMMRSIISDSEV